MCAFEQCPCPLFCCLRVPDELGVEVGAGIAGLFHSCLLYCELLSENFYFWCFCPWNFTRGPLNTASNLTASWMGGSMCLHIEEPPDLGLRRSGSMTMGGLCVVCTGDLG